MEKFPKPHTGVCLYRVKRAGGRSETSLYQQHLHPQGRAGKPPVPEMERVHPWNLLLRLLLPLQNLLTATGSIQGTLPALGAPWARPAAHSQSLHWSLEAPKAPLLGHSLGLFHCKPPAYPSAPPLVAAHIPQPCQNLSFTIIFFIFFPNPSVPRVIKSMSKVPPRKSRDPGEPQPPLITQHCFPWVCHELWISWPWLPGPGVLPWTPKLHQNRNLGEEPENKPMLSSVWQR